jgi:adenosine deaminase
LNQDVNITTFIEGLPKAELHMHIEGSIEAEMMFRLAVRNNVKLKWNSPEEIRHAYSFNNLQEFLDLYYDGCRVLVRDIDFYEVTKAYLLKAHLDNVWHAEMFLGPQGHTRRGISMATVLEGTLAAMKDAERECGITSALLLGAQRHLNEAHAIEMLEDAMPWAEKISGFGLGGTEVGNPPEKFSCFFKACQDRGFKTTAHAGEEGPAAYVRATVDVLHVDRIDHGNACMSDPSLVRQLVDSGIALTVCPLSNVRLKVAPSLASHPIAEMLESGLRVTINSDDPSYFGGYINANFVGCQTALDLSVCQIVTLAKNSFYGSFLSEVACSKGIDAINSWRAKFFGEEMAT